MHPISTSPIYVLLTGLEPFSDDTVNPAWEIARALEGWHHAGATVRAVQLLCVLDRAIERLVVALAKWQSKMVACLGLTGRRSEVSLERMAVNINDDPVAENVDQKPEDLAEMADDSAAYFSTFPIKAIVRDLQFQWLPSIALATQSKAIRAARRRV